MKVGDIMTTNVATTTADATVRDVAQQMLDRHVSGVPVVDADGKVVGMISEGDLIRRAELGTDDGKRRSWWLTLITSPEDKARDFVKTHSIRVGDVMTHGVATIEEDADLANVARMLERRKVKRLPVTRGGKLVGIVSRADLLRALATAKAANEGLPAADDRTLRDQVLKVLHEEDWAASAMLNVIVTDGVVHLWGVVDSDAQRDALNVAVTNVPGVKGVEDHLGSALDISSRA